MPWLKIDDSWSTHRKVRRAGKDGRALWIAAGTQCAHASSDLIDDIDLVDAAHNAEVKQWQKAAVQLVRVGLWHDSSTECERCEPCPEGCFRFHDWWEYQPTKDEATLPAHIIKWRRKKELQRDRELCERIIRRDKGCCRYCGIRVNWKDRRSNEGGTYDHVDPAGGNSMANVVVACRGCNIAKGERTPAEANMLLAPARSRLDPVRDEPTEAENGQNGSGPHARGGDGPETGREAVRSFDPDEETEDGAA